MPVQYELHSGKSSAELIYKLDDVFRSRPPALKPHHPRHWIHSFLALCKPDRAVLEAHALTFCAAIYGIRLFFEQELVTLTPQAAVTILNELFCALVLGCYHIDRHSVYSFGGFPVAKAVRLLCGKGANPNATARTTIFSVGGQETTKLNRTIWELHLDDTLPCGHYDGCFGIIESCLVMATLIEGGADLECRIPARCMDLQQAIEGRLEVAHLDRSHMELETSDKMLSRIKATLLKRGFVWAEPSP
jgi:hypothetical protein